MKPYYLEIEDKRLASLLANYSGRHLLQLSCHNLASLSTSPIPHKICIYSGHNCKPYADNTAYANLESVYTHLPFANDSIHLVIMPHTLETDKNAQSNLIHKNHTWLYLKHETMWSLTIPVACM